MFKTFLLATLLSIATLSFAIDFPEPSKSVCQDPQLLTDLASKMESNTNQDDLNKYAQFLQKCSDILYKK